MKIIPISRKLNYVTRATIFLIVFALASGMVGCDGNGSDPWADYIRIYDWIDLDDIRNNRVGKYGLMNDLDSTTDGYEELASPTANGGEGWQPIGTEDYPFTGTFNGQGYEIRELFINRPDEESVGLFGYVLFGVIKDIGTVNVTVTGYTIVGGLVGHNFGTVSNSYSSGDVSGIVRAIGGLVGYNGDGGFVSNSYSTASVTGDWAIGGLVGNIAAGGFVSKSYSSGSVTGNSGVGGLVGAKSGSGSVSNSFWDTKTSGQTTSAGGTGKTTAQMQVIATFSGAWWDIIGVDNPSDRNTGYVWNIVADETYPFLSWQS